MAALADNANPTPSEDSGESKQDESAPVSANWLDEMAHHVSTVLPSPGTAGDDLDTSKLLGAVSERAGRVYDMLFGSLKGGQLRRDVNGNIKQLSDHFEANPEATTMSKMLGDEITKKTLAKCKKASSGPVLSLLWFKRAQDFLCTLIEKFIEDTKAPSEYCSECYTAVLKPYHGWFTSKAAGMMMGSCPSRDALTDKFGFDTWKDAKEAMKRYAAQVRPFIETMQAIIDAHGCDFPDKV